ncbi:MULTISPECIES: hypothetical protein [Methylococcus]|jgi:hypothetical protein|uniref:Lipoprotein n=1 Tax=Methylococcus capsulatus TaxID=414 RepID=A0AA35UX30_METCP|nr:hypothetical protein [Methylococcus capsulatus]CAI8732452.1 protein of unknown function [Methylococcus capsulatus]
MKKLLLIPVVLACGCTGVKLKPEDIDKKTSFAIGREIGQFSISNVVNEGGAATSKTTYDARTKDGAFYKCYIVDSGCLTKVVTFGMSGTSDAVCAQMEGNASKSKPAPACNDLLRAAGQC